MLASPVDWQPIPDRAYHFAATVSDIACVLRLNDFPDENMASLLFGEVQHELDDFPAGWRLPRHRGD
ncbi:MAG: hypothetical protein C0478_07975 [Planctomyces sp.]|nr:hypothetical protein [Planctomyces sp.]